MYLFLTNLHLTTHNHSVGHSGTNSVPTCAVFCLGRAIPARQAPSERTRKCPKALDISLKLADGSAANPYWGMRSSNLQPAESFYLFSSWVLALIFGPLGLAPLYLMRQMLGPFCCSVVVATACAWFTAIYCGVFASLLRQE